MKQVILFLTLVVAVIAFEPVDATADTVTIQAQEQCAKKSTCYDNGNYVSCDAGDKVCGWQCRGNALCYLKGWGGYATCTSIAVTGAGSFIGALCGLTTTLVSTGAVDCNSQSCGCECITIKQPKCNRPSCL